MFRAFRSLSYERSFKMSCSPKTVSARHLHAAVKKALEAARKAHPDVANEPGDPTGTGVATLALYYRYPFICGLPPFPWIEENLGTIAEFNNTFVANLAQDKTISAVAAGGNFQPAVYASGGAVSIGFVPAHVSLGE